MDRFETAGTDPRADVIVALADTGVATSLVKSLSMRGFVVACAPGIRRIADEEGLRHPFVAIVDGADAEWLRDVSDLLRVRPEARVLALAEVRSAAELLAVVNAGVAGIVSSFPDDEGFARTVRGVLDGGVSIPRALVSALVDEVRSGRGRSVQTASGAIEVTDREWQILQLLLQRRSTREIAALLYVSPGTVRSHISALGRKLGAADREDTIRLLEQHRS